MLIVWIVFGLMGLAAAVLFLSAVRMGRDERDYPWMHPPDDDDGVSILEEVDQDGQDSR